MKERGAFEVVKSESHSKSVLTSRSKSVLRYSLYQNRETCYTHQLQSFCLPLLFVTNRSPSTASPRPFSTPLDSRPRPFRSTLDTVVLYAASAITAANLGLGGVLDEDHVAVCSGRVGSIDDALSCKALLEPGKRLTDVDKLYSLAGRGQGGRYCRRRRP
jgi:hypothetical protein